MTQESTPPSVFNDPEDAALEFQVKKEYYETRFGDYYQRLLELDRLDLERQKGVEETRVLRRLTIEQYEKTRREYARNRKAKPEEDPTLWQKELEEQKKIRDLNRKDYVKRKKELNAIMKKYNFIPEEEELGLTD